jgi:hypothetical protein
MKTVLALAAALALAQPAATRAADGQGADARPDGWSGTFSVWAGVSRYDVLGLRHGVAATGGKDLLSGNFDTIGGSVVLHHYAWEYGVLYEGTLMKTRAQSAFYTPVFGFGYDLTENVRMEALAEFGGHQISQIGAGSTFAAETRTVWLPYVGIRPGISYRIPLPDVRLVVGLSPFARWDLAKRTVEVRASGGPVSRIPYEAGGTAFGVVASLGLEL